MEKVKTPKNSKKKRLGRGLGSLLKVSEEEVAEQKASKTPKQAKPSKIELKSPKEVVDPTKIIHMVSIENIAPNKEQPRKVFNEAALEELTNSVREQGIMQPIVAIQKNAKQFEIIAGERRWRAAQRCGLKEVPVIVKEISDQNKLELAIIENIQRDDLNPIEEGEAYLILAKKYNLTQKEIAQKVGKDRATVANLIRVTGLASKVKEKVTASKISLGHAKVLLSVEDKTLQVKLAEKIERLNLSVRASESLVKNALNPELEKKELKYINEFKEVEEQLKRAFGTKFKINEKNGKGKIELNFHNMEQFNSLIEKLLG
ncbi:MAG: ParB/RepB/Spo0J family partition protein [Bdellovibrionales bacterium]